MANVDLADPNLKMSCFLYAYCLVKSPMSSRAKERFLKDEIDRLKAGGLPIPDGFLNGISTFDSAIANAIQDLKQAPSNDPPTPQG